MIKLLSIISSPRGSMSISGPERRVLNTITSWKEYGVDICFAYPQRGILFSEIKANTIPVYEFDMTGALDLGAIFRLIRIIRNARPDIVHSQGSPALDMVTAIAARMCGVKCCITRPVLIEDNIHYSRVKRILYNAIDRMITWRSCTAFIFVSHDGKNRYERRWGRDPKNIVIYNGVHTFGAHRMIRDGSAVHIGMAAHFSVFKGWDVFLATAERILKDMPDTVFHVYGSGHLHDEIVDRIAVSGYAKNILLEGFVKDPIAEFKTLDIYMHTSRREGLSVAILEAMSCGLPVVTSDVGGSREMVEHGINGYVVPTFDPEHFAERIKEIIVDKGSRLRFGEASQKRIATVFSQDAMLKKYTTLYNTVLKNDQ